MPPTAADPARRTFLVVDDELLVRDALQEIFAAFGHLALGASSGEEALEVAARHEGNLDAAFVDIKMPGLSGFGCVAALRRLLPGLPCVLMSGYSAEDLSGPLPADAIWLAKPFSLADVRRVLAAVG